MTALAGAREGAGSREQGAGALSPTAPEQTLDDRVRAVLAEVPDPEIPVVSVVDLGIVRRVEPGRVVITPTYTGCPATLVIEFSIRQALDTAGLREVEIKTELSPPWTTDAISAEGRRKLREYGISPPAEGAAKASLREQPAECPQCGSLRTEEMSRYGSTPCKAQWRCLDCLEPFDRFKCH